MRPLHILVFLLPLMAIYEIGSILYLTDPSGVLWHIADQPKALT